MYHNFYRPYPYYRRYYSIDPYYYRRYYNPYYNYMQNIVDSQVSDIDQSINNYGNMTDVIQDADVYQSMTPEPEHNDEQHSQTSFVPSNNLPELNSVEVVDDQYAQFNIQ